MGSRSQPVTWRMGSGPAPRRCAARADRVVGALGAGFRRRPRGEAALREAAAALTSAAAEVSSRLGYRPDGAPTAVAARALA